jgi:hypothetical protein
MKLCVCAVRALRRSVETGLNPRHGMTLTRLTQHLNKPVALPMRQMHQRLQDMFEINLKTSVEALHPAGNAGKLWVWR